MISCLIMAASIVKSGGSTKLRLFYNCATQSHSKTGVVKKCEHVQSFCTHRTNHQCAHDKSGDNVPTSKLPKKDTARYYGQPAPHTHPHLLQNKEVTPGIGRLEYSHRRQRFIEEVIRRSQRKHDAVTRHIVLIPSAVRQYMTNDIPYVFRQNTDFWYMCGFLEPDSVLLIEATRSKNITTLFVPPRNASRELWDGARAGTDGALALTGVDQALSFDELEKYLKAYLKGSRNFGIWYDYVAPVNPTLHSNVIRKFIMEERQAFVEQCRPIVQRQRLVKSPAEAELMRRTCQIAAEAMTETMKFSYPQLIQDGQLVLMDGGCELFGYNSDLTRTWPISGSFSEPQLSLYEAVLEVQKSCLNLCTPGVSLDSLYKEMCLMTGEKLKQLGILARDLSGNDLLKAMYPYCPHHLSHYLGMDIHDCSDIPRSIPLEPGMVITIEPGIYVPEKDQNAPEEFRGIGIRIEDDVLITDNVAEVMTSGCPKHPDQIERLQQTRQ
ncbi:PREDICTED: probable Xaa-Pro aminopeptidase 3 isoform X2 [Priapulus caudatus]|uniref:Probable Xaa-Pro aminopeptidase 3 isoform X2 n=1 Tax=Priapulus caudatus TaxID=37621 RepID=A0ABM1EUH6_PRICU|nr:PREDICTED: probable Xaa-Pro aminopeptidase 3 isoform X2 [Priapulus caudatus]